MSTSRIPTVATAPQQDNTGRIITMDYQAPAYAATISPAITAMGTIVGPVALTGACTFNPSKANSFIGDTLTAIFTNGTGGALVVTAGANCSVNGTLSVAAAKKGTISFIFDGATWVETGRAATA
jgi:hypothetical protein